jgi:hypothetical protein
MSFSRLVELTNLYSKVASLKIGGREGKVKVSKINPEILSVRIEPKVDKLRGVCWVVFWVCSSEATPNA